MKYTQILQFYPPTLRILCFQSSPIKTAATDREMDASVRWGQSALPGYREERLAGGRGVARRKKCQNKKRAPSVRQPGRPSLLALDPRLCAHTFRCVCPCRVQRLAYHYYRHVTILNLPHPSGSCKGNLTLTHLTVHPLPNSGFQVLPPYSFYRDTGPHLPVYFRSQ